LTPIWAACAAQSTPFQKGEAPTSGQQRMLGFLVLYLESKILTQMALEFKWYLKIQAHSKDKFKLLKSGIPRHPKSFF